MELLLGILIGIIFAIAAISIAIFFFRDKALLFFPDLLSKVNEQLITMADQKLGAKKDEFESLVKELKDEVRKSEQNRITSFSTLTQALKDQKETTEQLSKNTEQLEKVLSHNQLRGQWGEQVAEDLLRLVGFVKETDYIKNKKQDDSDTRPDFTVLLTEGLKINVDVKFPLDNLREWQKSEDAEAKNNYMKQFKIDVKNKIKQIVSRNYVNPADNTVDFAILFVPSEVVFSFIYEQLNDVWMEGMKQKVIFAGPLNFTAILRLIRQAHSNFKYQKNIHKIIKLINEFLGEFTKYNIEFEKIGERISSLSKQYDEVDITRTKKLVGTVDKIKSEEPEELLPTETPLIPDKEVVLEPELKN